MNTLIAGLCAIITTVTIGAGVNLKATDDVKKEIKNTPKVQTENYTYIENDYHKEYYLADDERLDQIEDKIDSVKTESNINKSNADNYKKLLEEEKIKQDKIISGQLKDTRTTAKTPWVGPKTHLCPYSAGWPAICGQCNKQGGIHQDIIEWMDENNDCHLTHKECFAKYCVDNDVWPNAYYQDKI